MMDVVQMRNRRPVGRSRTAWDQLGDSRTQATRRPVPPRTSRALCHPSQRGYFREGAACQEYGGGRGGSGRVSDVSLGTRGHEGDEAHLRQRRRRSSTSAPSEHLSQQGQDSRASAGRAKYREARSAGRRTTGPGHVLDVNGLRDVQRLAGQTCGGTRREQEVSVWRFAPRAAGTRKRDPLDSTSSKPFQPTIGWAFGRALAASLPAGADRTAPFCATHCTSRTDSGA